MDKLQTTYLGLKLRNPLIASSSGLTDNINRMRKLEDSGIGAIVMKSLFEEQISNEADLLSQGEDYPEALDYIHSYMHSNELDTYVNTLREAKQALRIPVIPSINCVGEGKWVDFAKRLEDAGADALEINIFLLPTTTNKSSSQLEEQYYKTIEKIRKAVKLPLSIKLSRQFTNPLFVLEQLHFRGIQGAVLFNRYYESEVDLEEMKLVPASVYSSDKELPPTLRWVLLASSQIEKLDLAVSSGVHSGADAAKCIASGAAAAQVCTVLYRHGPAYVKTLLGELEKALELTGAKSINDLKGKVLHPTPDQTPLYERSQFMKYFSSKGVEEI